MEPCKTSDIFYQWSRLFGYIEKALRSGALIPIMDNDAGNWNKCILLIDKKAKYIVQLGELNGDYVIEFFLNDGVTVSAFSPIIHDAIAPLYHLALEKIKHPIENTNFISKIEEIISQLENTEIK